MTKARKRHRRRRPGFTGGYSLSRRGVQDRAGAGRAPGSCRLWWVKGSTAAPTGGRAEATSSGFRRREADACRQIRKKEQSRCSGSCAGRPGRHGSPATPVVTSSGREDGTGPRSPEHVCSALARGCTARFLVRWTQARTALLAPAQALSALTRKRARRSMGGRRPGAEEGARAVMGRARR